MICPRCQTTNPENARFCLNCGTGLRETALCPNCGAPLSPTARFCSNCGYRLARSKPALMPDPVRDYLPDTLRVQLEAARAAAPLEGERRVVTMLFCDVKGSTALAEQLDPEVWAEIMNEAYAHLIRPVYRFEGTVGRLTGDGLLAFFGAPLAHENDAERAVRAGLEIVEGVQAYRQRLRQARGLDFDVRVGINTGLVVVGAMGSDLRMEYTAMGDAINLAARMEQTAQPGTVQITAHTYQLVASLVEAVALGEIALKGKAEPVSAYRVVGIRPAAAGLPATGPLHAPLVGREPEMSQLRQLAGAVRQGQGHIVCLIGETGLGKTRLMAELRNEWTAEQAGDPGSWGELRSVAHAAARPYEQFREHLLDLAGIAGTDPPAVVRAKLSAALTQPAPTPVGVTPALRARAVAVYSALFGAADDSTALGVQGEAFKRELFDVFLSVHRAWHSGGPTILALDDLHWTDPLSLELLTHLFQLVADMPILFLCAFRPDAPLTVGHFRTAMAARYAGHYHELTLNPLSPAESAALANKILDEAHLAPPVRAELEGQIAAKAEGNPLFIEELVRARLERGDTIPSEATDVPESLQGLLTARLDRLAAGGRRLLQLASVIGRSFNARVLAAIVDDLTGLDELLADLESHGILRRTTQGSETIYHFQHALMHAAAYQSLLLRQRRAYHRRVGEAMEALFAARLSDHAALLAHHFDMAEDPRARPYYQRAGQAAARLYATAEALNHYGRALELAEAESSEAARIDAIGVREARGCLLLFAGQLPAAADDCRAAITEARTLGRAADECRVMALLAWVLWSSGRGAESLATARAAETKAQALGEPNLVLTAQIVLAIALQNDGAVDDAHQRLRRTLLASRARGEHALLLQCWSGLAQLYSFMGRFDRSAACAQATCRLAQALGDRRIECSARFVLALAEGGRGHYDAALHALEAGRALAEATSSLWLARYPNQRAWLSAELGDWETAYRLDLAGLAETRAVPGFREFEISTLINLVLDCTALGHLDEAGAYLAEAQANVGRPEFGSHNWRWRTRLADARARLHLAQGDTTQAADAVGELLDWAEHTQARKYLARGRLLRAQVANGDTPAVEADLLAARDLADTLRYFPLRQAARAALADHYTRRGEQALAAGYRREAAQVLADLASTLQDPALRQSLAQGFPDR